MIYQITNNIIQNKKNGKKAGTVKKIIDTGLIENFPELSAAIESGQFKMGQEIEMPDVHSSTEIEQITQYDIEAEFIFPNTEDFEGVEEIMKKKHEKACETLDDKVDFQKQLKNHIRWFITNDWYVTGFDGTHYVFTKDL